MPDITMCLESTCPRKLTCHRFTAVPSDRQSYAYFDPEGCIYWINNYSDKDRNEE